MFDSRSELGAVRGRTAEFESDSVQLLSPIRLWTVHQLTIVAAIVSTNPLFMMDMLVVRIAFENNGPNSSGALTLLS